MVTIEVLVFDGCPNHRPTVQLAHDVADALGLGVEVHEVTVASPEDAEGLRFLGSPSVRVNGRDIEPGADDRTEFAFGCRVYGASGVPPRALLIAALEEARADE